MAPNRLFSLGLMAIACAASWSRAQLPEAVDDRSPQNQVAAGRDPGSWRPETARRVVKVFDFEQGFAERGGLPRGWFRAQDDPLVPRIRPGFPIYNQARIDRSTAAEGNASVMLPTQGGSTSLRLEPGSLPVFAHADYQVSGLIRTEGLKRARARLVAVLVDAEGEPIEASRQQSALILTDGSWQQIAVPVWGDFDEAAYLELELELLQPREYLPPELGDRQVWLQDISGAAWFDELRVVQLPRIEVRTASPANIVMLPDRPTLEVLVRDLTGEDLVARLIVYDDLGRLVDSWDQPVGSGRTTAQWEPDLERLGWYRAIIEVLADRGVVGRSYVDFIWVPGRSRLTTAVPRWSDPARVAAAASPAGLPQRQERGSLDRERFGLIAERLSPGELVQIPALLRGVGSGSITLPFWTEDLTVEGASARVNSYDPVLDELLDDWQRVTMSLQRAPGLLAAELRRGPGEVAAVLAADAQLWEPYLIEALDRFGQRVERWQLGALDSDHGLLNATTEPPAAADLVAADGSLARLVPGPVVTLPWEPGEPFQAERFAERGLDAALLHWPIELSGAALADTVASWSAMTAALPSDAATPSADGPDGRVRARPSDAPLPELVVVLDPPSREELGLRGSAAEIVKRTVEYWRLIESVPSPIHGHRHRIALRQPWVFGGGRRAQIMPAPELAAWRALIERLGERRVAGELDLGPEVRCYILGPRPGAPSDRGGALVAWHTGPAGSATVIEAYLGSGEVLAHDLYGNGSVVEPVMVEDAVKTAAARRSVHRVRVGAEPVFVEGVDSALVSFMSSLRVEPAFLPATVEEHRRSIVLTNPWQVPATGTLVVAEPGGRSHAGDAPDRSWTITPRRHAFSIPPGDTIELPLLISFNPAQEAGRHDFVFDVSLSAEREYGWLRMDTTVEVGLENIEMELAYSRGPTPGGPDLILEAQIVNVGLEPVTLEVTGFAPGAPRYRATITDLAPGEQAIRRFQLAGMAEALVGQRLSVRAGEVETGARLNKSIVVE